MRVTESVSRREFLDVVNYLRYDDDAATQRNFFCFSRSHLHQLTAAPAEQTTFPDTIRLIIASKFTFRQGASLVWLAVAECFPVTMHHRRHNKQPSTALKGDATGAALLQSADFKQAICEKWKKLYVLCTTIYFKMYQPLRLHEVNK